MRSYALLLVATTASAAPDAGQLTLREKVAQVVRTCTFKPDSGYSTWSEICPARRELEHDHSSVEIAKVLALELLGRPEAFNRFLGAILIRSHGLKIDVELLLA